MLLDIKSMGMECVVGSGAVGRYVAAVMLFPAALSWLLDSSCGRMFCLVFDSSLLFVDWVLFVLAARPIAPRFSALHLPPDVFFLEFMEPGHWTANATHSSSQLLVLDPSDPGNSEDNAP